jgi:hypothetical protein
MNPCGRTLKKFRKNEAWEILDLFKLVFENYDNTNLYISITCFATVSESKPNSLIRCFPVVLPIVSENFKASPNLAA